MQKTRKMKQNELAKAKALQKTRKTKQNERAEAKALTYPTSVDSHANSQDNRHLIVSMHRAHLYGFALCECSFILNLAHRR